MHSELSILSAEQFDDGVRFRPTRAAADPRKTSRDTEDGTPARKRSKTQVSDGAEPDDEEKKRSRGRPRLDTKDETAADVSCSLIVPPARRDSGVTLVLSLHGHQ
jgi:hypothetical protein